MMLDNISDIKEDNIYEGMKNIPFYLSIFCKWTNYLNTERPSQKEEDIFENLRRLWTLLAEFF